MEDITLSGQRTLYQAFIGVIGGRRG